MLEFLKKSDFFKTFFRREGSGATAKERLRLVLLSDHLSLAPDVVDALKAELFAVLSKYVDIDPARVRRRKRKNAAANGLPPKPAVQTNLVPGNSAQA